MQIHGPSVINPDPAAISVDVNAHDPERLFVKVEFPGGIRFYLDNGDADTLIKVFCQAKDMLHAHRHAAAMTDPLAPLRDREHYVPAEPVEGRVLDEADVDGMRIKAVLGVGPDPGRPERTATPAEHADTAARIERARNGARPPEAYMECVDSPVEVPEDAQAAEVRRIGKLHADGHITSLECAGMVDKVLG
jgi:hypothetical protein